AAHAKGRRPRRHADDAEPEHEERQARVEEGAGAGEETILPEHARPLGALERAREQPPARGQCSGFRHGRATIAARSGDRQSRARVDTAGARDLRMTAEDVLLAWCRLACLLVEERS